MYMARQLYGQALCHIVRDDIRLRGIGDRGPILVEVSIKH